MGHKVDTNALIMKQGKQLFLAVFAAVISAGFAASLILCLFSKYTNENQVLVLLSPIACSAFFYLLAYFSVLKSAALKLDKTALAKEISADQKANSSSDLSSNSGSEHKLAELTAQQVKALIQNAADVICLIDINCTILQVNPAAIAVWGYKPEELLNKNLRDFLETDRDIESMLQALQGAEKSIDQIHFENRFRKKNGRIIDLLWSAHWSVSDGGLFCVAHNITERKRAEQLVRESEEKVRSILENIPVGVVLVNRSGCLEFMNESAAVITDYDKGGDLSEIRAAAMFSFCKEPFIMKQIEDLSKEKLEPILECFVTNRAGERIPAEASVSLMNSGAEQSGLIIFLDVRAKQEAERTKREFIAMVSHDLRTPLTSISMVLSYLADGHGGELSSKGLDFARRSKQECERLMQLIKDLLDLEKMKAGKFSMNYGNANLTELIIEAVRTVERSKASQGVQMTLDLPDNLYSCCDGARIIQVLVNLLDNAVKYSPQGKTVKIEAEKLGNQIIVSVSNEGRPIPEEKLLNIFEKFEQVDTSDARERKGTGLGLAICKTIVEQHDGRIWVAHSTPAETRFSFSLPTAEAETADNLSSQSF